MAFHALDSIARRQELSRIEGRNHQGCRDNARVVVVQMSDSEGERKKCDGVALPAQIHGITTAPGHKEREAERSPSDDGEYRAELETCQYDKENGRCVEIKPEAARSHSGISSRW